MCKKNTWDVDEKREKRGIIFHGLNISWKISADLLRREYSEEDLFLVNKLNIFDILWVNYNEIDSQQLSSSFSILFCL
jgi:hypothetical protein